MSRFFVGQRVRVVRIYNPSNLGLVGRIGSITQIEPDWYHDGPGFGLDIEPIDYDDGAAFGSEQLEPILPEGHAPSEFASLRDLLDALEAHA